MIRSRDDRRRRALTDEALRTDDVATHRLDSEAEHRFYAGSEHALAERRLRDLIPRKRRFVAATAAVLLVVSSLLIAGCLYISKLTQLLQVPQLLAFDLGQPWHLVSAWTSFNLLAATLLGMVIFSLRRGRLDDYRGQYRWWGLFVALTTAVTLGTMAPVAELVQAIGTRLTGYHGVGAAAIWWLGPSLVLWGTVSIRLAFEVRRSWPTAVALGLTLTLWSASLLVRFENLVLPRVSPELLLWSTQMLAAVTLHFGCVCYARHLLLEIDGVIKTHSSIKATAKPKPPRKLWSWGKKQLATDQPHGSSDPSTKPTAKSKSAVPKPHFAPAPVVEEEPEEAPAPGGKVKLSRAERKRLRKLNSQQGDDEDDD